MGGGKSKAPKAPNYMALAQMQGDQAKSIANQLTTANRPTQYDAYGNMLSWTKGPGGQWTQRVTLGDPSQQSLDNYLGNQQYASGRFGEALRGFDFTPPEAITQPGGVPQYDPTRGDRVADALYGSVMDRAGVQQQRDTAAMENKLRLQGLVPGTQAYDRAMRNLLTSQGDVNALAAQNAVLGGYGEARAQYQDELSGYGAGLQGEQQAFAQRLNSQLSGMNNLGALAGYAGGPIGTDFAGFTGATGYSPPDLMGAAQAGYNAQMSGYNSGKSAKGGLLGAGASLGGAYLGGK